jgi:hypothetical protein
LYPFPDSIPTYLFAEHEPFGEKVAGQMVAGHLGRLFTRRDPHLFCKGDNGGNLNHAAVDQILAETLVIPNNSPVNRPS